MQHLDRILLLRLLAQRIQHLRMARRLPSETKVGIPALSLQCMHQPTYLHHQRTRQ